MTDERIAALEAEVAQLKEYNQRLGDNTERALREYAKIAHENTVLRIRLDKIRKLATILEVQRSSEHP